DPIPQLYLQRTHPLLIFPDDLNAVAQGGEPGVASADYIILRTRLHARIDLPAHVGLDAIGTTIGRIDVHDVGREDIHAVSAAVATRHINKCGHGVTFSPA